MHLLRRFVGSLRPGGPSETDQRWAASYLLPSEAELWAHLSDADRRHAVEVARGLTNRLGEAERPVVAAALLHDIGKLASGLGTAGRVLATLLGMTVRQGTVATWSQAKGFRRRVADYLRHPEEGEILLTRAGSDPFTVAWAAEHHRPPRYWTVDRRLGEALAGADHD